MELLLGSMFEGLFALLSCCIRKTLLKIITVQEASRPVDRANEQRNLRSFEVDSS